MVTPVVNISDVPYALAIKAVDLVTQAQRDAIAQRGRFTLVLSGGSTPEKTYSLLAEPGRTSAIDWVNTFIFLSDERFVPAEDLRSNYGMIQRLLTARVPIPPSNVFPVPTKSRSAAEAAKAYDRILMDLFNQSDHTIPPRFDLILLGLGSDGHTCSLFPFADALSVTDAWVTLSPAGTLPPTVDRVTLTYPILNAARQVLFLASGKSKAAALRDILEEKASYVDRPAAGVKPVDGTVTWLVDKEAAQLLTHKH